MVNKPTFFTLIYLFSPFFTVFNCQSFVHERPLQVGTFFVSLDDLYEFAQLYENRPVRSNPSGMKSVGLFWLWFVIRNIQPDIVIESGIYKGLSTWVIEQAASNARIISIDPRLSLREYISPRVEYRTQDFSTMTLGDTSALKVVCFFDDHQDADKRLQQSIERGFNYLIFDDNYPFPTSHISLDQYFKKGDIFNLYSHIGEYTVLPQLIGRVTKTLEGEFVVESLSLNSEDKVLSIYQEDALSYRWITYVSLVDAS